MAKSLTPTEVADKQVERTRGAVEFFEKGVAAVTVSPTHLAAQSLEKAKDNYREAIDSGRMGKRLEAVSLEDWQKLTLAKSGRIGEGVEAARDKIVDFHTQRSEAQGRIDTILDKMPTRTPSEMEQRMLTQIRSMRKFQFIPR